MAVDDAKSRIHVVPHRLFHAPDPDEAPDTGAFPWPSGEEGEGIDLSILPTSGDPLSSGRVSGLVASGLFLAGGGPGYWIRDDKGGVEVAFANEHYPRARVVRLSPTGLWFTPDRRIEYPSDTPVEVRLHSRGRDVAALRARVVTPRVAAEEPIFGLHFVGVELSAARQIVALIRELSDSGEAKPCDSPKRAHEDIVEPGRIRSIVKALAGFASGGFVAGRRDVAVRLVAFEEERGAIRWQGVSGAKDGPWVVDLTGYNSVYRLHIPNVQVVGDSQLASALPTRIERTRQRQFRRGEVDASLTVAFGHPIWPLLAQIARPVRDISFGGICFHTEIDDDLLLPGLDIPSMEISDANGERIFLRGEVRAVSISGEETVARVSVTGHSPQDEIRWNRLVARLLYPTTQNNGELAESVWNLFRDSGYFNLSGKAPEQFEGLRNSYLRFVRLGATRPQIICNAVFPSSRGVDGAFSIMKMYRGSWMLHQLAKRRGTGQPGSSRLVLRDLYTRALEHAQTDPRLRWIFGYAEASVLWNQITHFAFAARYAASGKAMSRPFQLLEASVDRAGPSIPEVLEIGRATTSDVEVLLDHVRGVRPRCFLDVLDLEAAGDRGAGTRNEWSAAGLLRERAIYVARSGGVPIAASIMECCETGANLFRVTDCLRMFPLVRDGEAALPSLLSAARSWFRAHGKDAFVYFREDEDPGPTEMRTLRDLGEGRLWVISAELLSDFIEHLFEVTSWKHMSREQADAAAPGR